MECFTKAEIPISDSPIDSEGYLQKGIPSPPEIKIKRIPDESHNIIEIHEIKDKSSSSIILEVLPRPSDCENIVIFGEESNGKLSDNTLSRYDRPNSGKINNSEPTTKSLGFQCFHCGFDCKVLSHLEQHYNVLRLTKPFESREIGFECKFSPSFTKAANYCSQNKFSCPACKFSSSDENILKEHISELHTKEAPFLCSECQVTFKTKLCLANHLLVHASEKPYRCPHCKFSCKLKRYLKSHIKLFHSSDKPFSCSKCSFRCKRKVDVSKHELTHTAEKPYHCRICDFKSKSIHYLKKHMLIHKGTLPFHCSVCDYRCVTKYILRDHYINHHSHEKPFQCSLCGLCFKRNTTLSRHMITHTEAKPFECNLCNFTCSRKDNLKSHLTVAHTDLKPFKCGECDFMCKMKTALKLHVKVHSQDRPYVCERCNYRFKSENKLRRHAVSHSFERWYPCSHCPFQSKTRTDLKVHITSNHSVKGLLSCVFCEFVCKEQITLEKHMPTHGVIGPLSYHCNQCNLSFNEKVDLKNHILSHASDTDVKTPYDNHYEAHSTNSNLCDEIFKHDHVSIHINSEVLSDYPQIKVEAENTTELPLREFSEMEIIKLSDNNNEIMNSDVHHHDITEHKSLINFQSEDPIMCIVPDGLSCFDKKIVSHVKPDYQCEYCPFRCSKKIQLKQHSKIHNNSKSYGCPKCEEICITKTELKDHLSIKHSDYKPFHCEHCDQTFKLKSNLKQHSVIHSEEKPYQCHMCDYRTKLRGTLRRHYVTHTIEKPYQCHTCNYRCKLKEKLKRHLIIHSEDRPFRCDECYYTCKTKELLKKHYIVHTREKTNNLLT